MNIFFLSKDPRKCAEYLGDKHVIKMTLETAQLLSTAHRSWGGSENVYKATHIHHPITKWVCNNTENYLWALNLFSELLLEYRFRYDRRTHKSSELLPVLSSLPPLIPIGKIYEPPKCMPKDIADRHYTAVKAYREYYLLKYRRGVVQYNRLRQMPQWLKELIGNE